MITDPDGIERDGNGKPIMTFSDSVKPKDSTPRTDAWINAHHSHKKLIDFARSLELELARKDELLQEVLYMAEWPLRYPDECMRNHPDLVEIGKMRYRRHPPRTGGKMILALRRFYFKLFRHYRRLELRLCPYKAADVLLREAPDTWRIAKEEDENYSHAGVYLERYKRITE